VNGPAVSKSSVSTEGVGITYNCSGGEVLAIRLFVGVYVVEFAESPVALALVTPLGGLSATFASVEMMVRASSSSRSEIRAARPSKARSTS
jgi:hypothetical protein